MPGKKSEDQQPKKGKTKKQSQPIPEPSPALTQDEANAWEKEKSDPSGQVAAEPKSELRTEPSKGPKPVTHQEETTWAVIAHLSVLLNLITGFLGGVAALVIYFIYKDRSRFVAYHAMQSLIFQSITWLGGGLVSGVLIAVSGALSFLILPLLCLIPGFLILLLIPISLIYGVIGAVQVSNGEDFRYWIIGDWVRSILEPK